MRVAILLVLALLLIAPEALAVSRWQAKTVAVYDFSGWPEVGAQVAALNAAMPRRVPRLVHHPMSPRTCVDTPRRRAAIVVCVDDSATPQDAMGHVLSVRRGREMLSARVWLSPHAPPEWRASVACQELGHVLFLSNQDPGEDPAIDSCVLGTRSSPGPIDVAYARKVYKKHR